MIRSLLNTNTVDLSNRGLHSVYLLTGSNMGDRELMLETARKGIEVHIGVILKKSSIYKTAAWGKTDQPDFLNQVLVVATQLSPMQTLEVIVMLELRAGRKRQEKWGPRTLDIDILFYDDWVLQTAALTVPHPALQDRRFTLVPLVEIAPDLEHPVLKRTTSQLLLACADQLETIRL